MIINAINAIMNACGLILPVTAACIQIALIIWALVRNIQDRELMSTKPARGLIWANCAMAEILILMGLAACLYKQKTTIITSGAAGGVVGKAGWSMYAAGDIYMSLPLYSLRISAMPLYLMGTFIICIYMWIEISYSRRYIPALTTGISLIIYAVSTLTAHRWLVIGTGLTAALSVLLLYADSDIARIRGEGTILQNSRIRLNKEYAEKCGDIKLDKSVYDLPDGFRKTVLLGLEERKQVYRELQGDIEFCDDVYRAMIKEIRELVIWTAQILFAVGLLLFAIVHEDDITGNVTAADIATSAEGADRMRAHAITMLDTERFILLGIFGIILFTACLTLIYIFLFTDPIYTPLTEPTGDYEQMRVSDARALLLNDYQKEKKLYDDIAKAETFATFMDIKQMFSVAYDSTYDSETGTMTTTACVTPAPNNIQFIEESDTKGHWRYTPKKFITDAEVIDRELPMHPGAVKKRMLRMTVYPEYGFLKKEGIFAYREGVTGEFARKVDRAYRKLMLSSLNRAASAMPSSVYELGSRAITKSSLKGYLRSGIERDDSGVRELMHAAFTGEGLETPEEGPEGKDPSAKN